MRAAVYYNNSDIRIEELDKPEIESNQVLLKIESSGICGSDLMEWYRLPKAPLVLGHEVTGTVVEKGDDVEIFNNGDRVVVTHHVPCNTCHYCLTDRHTVCPMIKKTSFYPGGFSEYLRVPGINVERGMFRLPDNVTFDEGTFTEPLGCVIRGIRNIGISPGESVAIIGSGITGLLNLQYILGLSPSKVFTTDIDSYKMEKALEFGSDYSINSGEDIVSCIRDKNSGFLCDLVIVCTGVKSALQQAIDIVEKGGRILFFAPAEPDTELNIDFNDLWWKGVKISSSYAAAPKDLELALQLIAAKRVNVKKMITHVLPLEEIQNGFNLVGGQSESLKVLVHPHDKKS